ncbi:MAG: hypothetical protein WB870_17005 [Gallionellaceae bacterium]
MSAPEKFSDAALAANLVQWAGAAFTREKRIKLLGELAQALLAGEVPSREAALFIGGAIASWLQDGDSLEKTYLKVTKRHSHHTPQVIWQMLIEDERQKN